jgi:hypothetical protein
MERSTDFWQSRDRRRLDPARLRGSSRHTKCPNVVFADREQDSPSITTPNPFSICVAPDNDDAGEFRGHRWVLPLLTCRQYLIWPTVENMRATPEWVLPAIGKQDVTPYDILIDLIPW